MEAPAVTDLEQPPQRGGVEAAASAERREVANAAPIPPPERSRFGALRHRHFRNVWIGALISSFGGWMELTGVQWIVSESRDSVILAYLAAAQLGPTLVLGLWGGILADRVNRKTLLLVTQGIMMLIALTLAVTSYLAQASPEGFFGRERMNTLLLLSLLQGITMAFNMPAWQVLTPRLVPREDLTDAMALNGLQFNAARIVGPALGGLLMGVNLAALAAGAGFDVAPDGVLANLSGATLLFIINTVTFVAVMFAVSTTPDAPAPPRGNESVLALAWEGLRFILRERGPRAAFVSTVVFSLCAAPLMRVLPLVVRKVYALDESVFGTLLAAMGAGAVAGVLVLRRIPAWYPKHHLMPLSNVLGAIAIIAFASTRSVAIGYVTIFFAGAFWLWAFNCAFAALQLLVDDRMRGRVLSVANMAVFGAMPLGTVLGAMLGEGWAGFVAWVAPQWHHDGLDVQLTILVPGLALLVASLAMLIWRVPELDGLRQGDPGLVRRPGLWRGITGAAHRPPPARGLAPPAYDSPA